MSRHRKQESVLYNKLNEFDINFLKQENILKTPLNHKYLIELIKFMDNCGKLLSDCPGDYR